MNFLKPIFFAVGCSLFSMSCIKEAAKNMEADIIAVDIADSLINSQPIINNNNVVIYVKTEHIDIKNYALYFDLTPGATITPESGTYHDFTTPVTYTVTSEDGKHTKSYQVSLVENSIPTAFDFEDYEFNDKKHYVVFYEKFANTPQYLWGSGNAPFALLAGSNPTSEKYPTQVSTATENVQNGVAALYLETKSTGFLGKQMNMPIAAGNLFTGSIDASSLTNPITKMGLPFGKVPTHLEGYYQYIPGDTVIDKTSTVLNTQDSCDIYAVLFDRVALYESTGLTYLSNDNILTDPSIVAIAKLEDGSATGANEWKHFSLPFHYINTIDRTLVPGLRYNIAVVFSSSKNGAIYQGAVGSVLKVDNVKIITE